MNDQFKNQENDPLYDRLALVLLVFLTGISLLHWSDTYPYFNDIHYHMGTVEGFRQAGGVVFRDFWEMAPGGRPHIYFPFLHAVGFLLTYLGISPLLFGELVCWIMFPLSLLGTWLLMRELAGPRAALLCVALLAAPSEWLFNQTAHNANALALVLALFSFYAFLRGKSWVAGILAACGVYTHYSGLMIPLTYFLYGIHRPREIKRAWIISFASVFFFLPWGLHMLANRDLVFTRDKFFAMQGNVFRDPLVFVMAAVGIVTCYWKRQRLLLLPCVLIGFAPMILLGYGWRFTMFNAFLPVSLLGATGIEGVFRSTQRLTRWSPGPPVAVGIVLAALFLDPAMGPGTFGPFGPPGRLPWQLNRTVRWEPTAAMQLVLGMKERGGPTIHSPGMRELLYALRKEVKPGDILFCRDSMIGPLVTAVTGAWTNGSMLSEARSDAEPTNPRDYPLVLELRNVAWDRGGGPPMPFPQRGPQFRENQGAEVLLDIPSGTLIRQSQLSQRTVELPPPVVGLFSLLLIFLCLIAIACFDLWGDRLPAKLVKSAPWIGAGIVLLCLLPMLVSALREFDNPSHTLGSGSGLLRVAGKFSPPSPPPDADPQGIPPDLMGKRFEIERIATDLLTHWGDSEVFLPRAKAQELDRLLREKHFDEADKVMNAILGPAGRFLAPPPFPQQPAP